MELLYLYIPIYKTINNQGFNFSNRYQFTSKIEEQKKITIEKHHISENGILWQTDFFNPKISNLSVIVGNNGSGKTSVLEFIAQELTIGGNSLGYDFIAIFESNELFYIKSRQDNYKFELKFELKRDIDGIQVINYYPLSDLTFSNPHFYNQIGSLINISDNAMIYEDFEREINLNRSLFGQQFVNFAFAPFIGSNIERELEFFLNDHIGEITPADLLSINVSDIEIYLNNEINETQNFIDKNNEKKDFQQYEEILYNLNYLKDIINRSEISIPKKNAEKYIFTRALTLMLLIDIQTQLKSALRQLNENNIERISGKINQRLAQSIQKLNKSKLLESDYLSCLKEITSCNEKNLNISERANNIYDFINVHLGLAVETKSQNTSLNNIIDNERSQKTKLNSNINLFFNEYPQQTKEFIQQLKKNGVSNKLISYRWRNYLLTGYQYSTGEQQLIKLYSRLNYAFNRLESRQSAVLILLDEAELGMHPDWQKKFLLWLIKYTVNNDVIKNKKVQFILTTHSPLMLSDIPSQNVIRLNDGKISPYSINSFGANLYDLLNDSFFFKEGFIGEFAKEKLNSLIEYIENGELESEKWSIKKASEFIDLIGEPIIREELRGLFLDKYMTELENDHLTKQIDRLTSYRDSKNK